MAITTRDTLISAVAAGRMVTFSRGSISGGAAGQYLALYRAAGVPFRDPTSIPATTGATLDRTSQGALPIPAPSGTSYITAFQGVSSVTGSLVLCDRLVEYGGLSFITTTPQTVTTVALPTRATGATDVELWLEVYTAGGGTQSLTVTCSYTNQSGASGRTATLIGGITSTNICRAYQFALQAGDTGVQSVQSFTSTTSTGTAGNGGLVLRRSLLTGAIPAAGIGFQQGWSETDIQVCPDNACLELLMLVTGTTTGNISGNFGFAQG
jgi:hypothetical protein